MGGDPMSATWTASPQQVERAIGAVLPHASGDQYFPVINNVRLEIEDDRFIALATDRFTMGICRASLSDWTEDAAPVEKVAASLRLDDVKRLFAFLRSQRKDVATWTLTDETLTVRLGDETALTIRTLQAEGFPNWRKLVAGVSERENEPGAQMAFAPHLVDHFQKSAKALGEISFTWQFTSPLKPVIVQIGQDFLGILMPQRIPSDALALDLGAFGIETTKAVTR